jgi:hypothetical protein
MASSLFSAVRDPGEPDSGYDAGGNEQLVDGNGHAYGGDRRGPAIVPKAQFHSSSASRVTAGAAGFLTLSQLTTRPDR